MAYSKNGSLGSFGLLLSIFPILPPFLQPLPEVFSDSPISSHVQLNLKLLSPNLPGEMNSRSSVITEVDFGKIDGIQGTRVCRISRSRDYKSEHAHAHGSLGSFLRMRIKNHILFVLCRQESVSQRNTEKNWLLWWIKCKKVKRI